MESQPFLEKSCFSAILYFVQIRVFFETHSLQPQLESWASQSRVPPAVFSMKSHHAQFHAGKFSAGFTQASSLTQAGTHKKQQKEHRAALPWGKYAQPISLMATRSTSANLYSSLTTGSIYVPPAHRALTGFL